MQITLNIPDDVAPELGLAYDWKFGGRTTETRTQWAKKQLAAQALTVLREYRYNARAVAAAAEAGAVPDPVFD